MKTRRLEQENKLASQASRIQSLESRLQNRQQQLESQAIEIKSLQTEIIDLTALEEAHTITIKRHNQSIKVQNEFILKKVRPYIISFRENFKFQSIKTNDQERELNEKLALYEANLLQKVKKIILAELLGSETQPSDNIGGKHEPRIVCSPQFYGFDAPNSSQKAQSIFNTTLTTY